MKLSPFEVRTLKLPEGKSEAIYFDADVPGFGLRLREGGSRTFVFQYKLGAKQRRMNLGVATALSVANVRKIAERLHARVKLGEDPASDKADAMAKAVQTFKAVTTEYLGHQRRRLRPRSYPDVERHLLKHAKALHELQLAKIERRDIAVVIGAVAKNSGLVTANRVRTSLSSLYSWALERGITDGNPVIGTARNEERSRERVLYPSELGAIWNILRDDDYGAIIKLLMLTGQRAGEIAGLCWSEVAEDVITFPANRTKNDREHVVPLSAPARKIIEGQQRRVAAYGRPRDLMFGRHVDSGPFSGWSKSKKELDERIAKAIGKPLSHWTPHDLRRTFATYAGGGLPEYLLKKIPPRDQEMACGLGIQPHVIEAVLNHVSGHKAGVAGIYNRSTYQREKKQALDLWAAHLMAIVESRDATVVPLSQA